MMFNCLASIPCSILGKKNKITPVMDKPGSAASISSSKKKLTLLVLSNQPSVGKSRWIYRISNQASRSQNNKSGGSVGGERSARFLPTLGFDVTQRKTPAGLPGLQVLTFYEIGGLASLQSLWPGYLLDSDGVIFMATTLDDLDTFRQKVLPSARKSLLLLLDSNTIQSHHIADLVQMQRTIKVVPFDPVHSYNDLSLISWFQQPDQKETTTINATQIL